MTMLSVFAPPLLHQCRTVCNEQLERYPATTELEHAFDPSLFSLYCPRKVIESDSVIRILLKWRH